MYKQEGNTQNSELVTPKEDVKLTALQEKLRKKGIDVAYFIAGEQPEPNITYFSGIRITHAATAITPDSKPTLYCSALDYNGARTSSKIDVLLVTGSLLKTIKGYHPKKIGIIPSAISYGLYTMIQRTFRNTDLVDISEYIFKLRATKTEEEVANIKKAASIADEAFDETISDFSYSTEAELKAKIEYEMAASGASPSFSTIVASGPNAAVPHHPTGMDKLRRGFCIIDFGANYSGYCSDCTRTIFIGKPTEKEIQLYKRVLCAQEAAIDKLMPGISVAKLDASARNALGSLKKYFTHSLGHGIGIEVHEPPTISAKSNDMIKQGMAVTIEPGVYIPEKYGIRIEDLFIIGNKARSVTLIPKELISFNVR